MPSRRATVNGARYGMVSRLFCDICELILVQCLRDGDMASMDYKLKRFARLFSDPVFVGMVMSCHVCCNSDLYITFAELKFGA
mmetsp:Transcript_75087/g.176134  ORF Transcript_75087/g.176134 Transcript_75087/m.176134 type:complete len:83 (-) Transcript_75087:295-543(-)